MGVDFLFFPIKVTVSRDYLETLAEREGAATGSHFCWQKWGPMREGEVGAGAVRDRVWLRVALTVSAVRATRPPDTALKDSLDSF